MRTTRRRPHEEFRVRAVMLDPPKIATLLDDRFRFLTTGRRTALPRQRTLRATLDWSYDLLLEEEARLLRQLGIFAGDFLLEAAIAVAGNSASGEVTDHLANLVAKSLVVADIRGDRQLKHLVERQKRLGAGRALADEARPHRIVERGKSVGHASHGYL